MAKVKELKNLTVSQATETPKKNQDEQRILDYQEEFNRWLNILSKIHTNRFDTNYRQYTSYADTQGTDSKISDPMAPELVERVIQKLFEREPKFFAHGYGKNLPKEITNVIEATAEYLWENHKVIQATGTMRSKLKVGARDFCVTGNMAVETYYNDVADSPDFRVIPIEDVVFDPTTTLKSSPVYYIRQHVSLKYLEDNAEKTVTTEDGRKVKQGLFKNIEKLKEKYQDAKPSMQNNPDSNRINRSGGTGQEDPVNDILMVSRWEGKKCCRMADWDVVIQEWENDILDDDPLDFAMDIEVPKQCYAFSLLDFINGLTHAKDMILNQVVDYGSKALNPPLFVDPSLAAVNRHSLRNAFRLGGIVFAAPGQAAHLPMPQLPTAAFDMLTYMQQRAESASGIGAYLGGVPNQESDKTQGTKGGILALMQQATSPVRDRQISLEESIIEPVFHKVLKYTAQLMGEDQLRFVLMTGESPQWVSITKGILTGKITLPDLLVSELVLPEEAQLVAQEMVMNGLDPETEILFDSDWFLRVEAGSMAEQDKELEVQSFDDAIAFGLQLGVPIDSVKVWKERMMMAGKKEPEQYLMAEQPQIDPMTGQPMAPAQMAPNGMPMPQNAPQEDPMMQPQPAMAPGGF